MKLIDRIWQKAIKLRLCDDNKKHELAMNGTKKTLLHTYNATNYKLILS